MRRPIPGASRYGTLCLARIQDLVVTGDASGKIALWDPTDKRLIRQIPAFRSRVLGLAVTGDSGLVIAMGADGGGISLKRVDVFTGQIEEIPAGPDIAVTGEYSCLGVSALAHCVYVGTKKGTILRYDRLSKLMNKIGQDSAAIVGIQVLDGLDKLLYATAYAVKDLTAGKTLYQAPGDPDISLLGYCRSNGDLYIGMGPDVVQYNFSTQKDHLLAPLHKAVVTSCHCADSTGSFLTTSLDNNAILWSPNGNSGQVLKGSRSELYDGDLAPDGSYAITAGNREMNAGEQADTGTLKFWYLKGFLKKEFKEAHFMGVTASVMIGGAISSFRRGPTGGSFAGIHPSAR